MTSSMWSSMHAGGGASGSRLASSIVGGWPRQVGPRLAMPSGGLRGSSAEGQGDWVGLVLGSTVETWSASAPGCLCRIVLPYYAKENSDPEVVSVLLSGVLVCESRCMEKCAQSILQLPSEPVVACGNWTLRS